MKSIKQAIDYTHPYYYPILRLFKRKADYYEEVKTLHSFIDIGMILSSYRDFMIQNSLRLPEDEEY